MINSLRDLVLFWMNQPRPRKPKRRMLKGIVGRMTNAAARARRVISVFSKKDMVSLEGDGA